MTGFSVGGAAGYQPVLVSASSTYTAPIYGIHMTTGGILRVLGLGGLNIDLGTLVVGTQYTTITLPRINGCFYLIKGGTFTNWTLLYPSDSYNFSPVYARQIIQRAIIAADTHRLVRLPANAAADWTNDNVWADTSQPSTGAYTHPADCIIQIGVTHGTGLDNFWRKFRAADGSNYWAFAHSADGSASLIEVVANTQFTRGSMPAGTILNLQTVKISMRDTEITITVADSQKIRYTAASNFKTATAGDTQISGAESEAGTTIYAATVPPLFAADLDMVMA
jgi:hypothetical protein